MESFGLISQSFTFANFICLPPSPWWPPADNYKTRSRRWLQKEDKVFATRAPERGPQPSRKENWATGPKGKRSGEFWRGPASKGLKPKWTVERVFDGPLYLLVPPPSPLSPSLPLLLSLFLMTTLYAASFRKSPVIAFGYSCCPPTATPATGQYLILCLLPPSQHCGWLRQRPPSF